MAKGDSPAPYHFIDDGKEIEVHPAWARYLIDNMAVVRGWTLWHWLRFLEVRNPNTPSLAAKVTGITRGSLDRYGGFPFGANVRQDAVYELCVGFLAVDVAGQHQHDSGYPVRHSQPLQKGRGVLALWSCVFREVMQVGGRHRVRPPAQLGCQCGNGRCMVGLPFVMLECGLHDGGACHRSLFGCCGFLRARGLGGQSGVWHHGRVRQNWSGK